MGKLFDWDSPLIQALNKISDLIILNFLVLLSSIPLITIGAAQAALYDVTGRMLRQEEQIWKNYWQAFRNNFKQATIMWLGLLAVGVPGVFTLLFYFSADTSSGAAAMAIMCMVLFLWAGILTWVFPLQSRFENPVQYTLRNALYCAVMYLPRTLIMVVLNMIPWALLFCAFHWFMWLGMLWVFIWFSLAARWNMHLLKKPFAMLEEMSQKQNS